MERSNLIKTHYYLYYFIIVYTVGLIGHLVAPLRETILLITPYFLFLNTGILLLYIFLHKELKLILWCVFTIILTIILEIIGVKTGLVFGDYSYGSGLGFKVFEVPLAIGFNWLMVILGIMELVRHFNISDIAKILLAAFIAVVFDFYLEPTAIRFDYWSWDEVVIPVKNYIDWVLTATIFSTVYFKLEIKTEVKPALYYFVIQFGFFAILYFAGLLF